MLAALGSADAYAREAHRWQGRTERTEGATSPSVAPSAFTNGQLAAYTHFSLANSTKARISPVGLTVKCTVSFT
jgi:hypothetical protein